LLLFIEHEIVRTGGGSVSLYADQLEAVGSRSVVLPGLSELRALRLIGWQRYPKRCVISLSDRWRMVETRQAAMTIITNAREQCVLQRSAQCSNSGVANSSVTSTPQLVHS
jgi:hypothetical protein